MLEIQPTVDSVFAYGTLKRGQCRETLWPIQPTKVIPGWVRGTLYGRDDFPALLSGNYRVIGELWVFESRAMEQLLAVLDEIEHTHCNSPSDLYHRHIVDVHDEQGEVIGPAFAYFYHRDPLADGFSQAPVTDGNQSWPG